MLNRPKLRAVEVFPIQQEAKTLVYLKDPENFAQPLGISLAGYFIISYFDGQHSLVDIQEAYLSSSVRSCSPTSCSVSLTCLISITTSRQLDSWSIETGLSKSLKGNPSALPPIWEASIAKIPVS